MTKQETVSSPEIRQRMMPGFCGLFESEALPGALPVGRNSPQKVAYGLYAEQISGTAFTAPRHENRHSWAYRMRPSADHPPYRPYEGAAHWLSAPFEAEVAPNRWRWEPLPFPQSAAVDFVDGMITYAGNGAVGALDGMAVHLYAATEPMTRKIVFDADGELLILPQEGRLELKTELGAFSVAPQQIAVIPRGLRFRVELGEGPARGYVCENYGAPFRLPELGPIGANGLANARDFETPQAWFEDVEQPFLLVQKFQGRLWATGLDRSPLDVVAWHGNLAPYRYDLRRFNALNSVSFDHPDPSIFTVLTSPSGTPGTANVDFVIFPPRWVVAEDTFRPPWFHRNVMSEFMGLVNGAYDAKAQGFVPGGASLHNQMASHGPDRESYAKAVEAELKPHRSGAGLAFMFESRMVIRPTAQALNAPTLQKDYDSCWQGFAKARIP